MGYSKSELRNNHMPLLRRVQRQMDKRNENKPIVLQPESIENITLKPFAFESEDESILPKKKTRLNLYKKRGGR